MQIINELFIYDKSYSFKNDMNKESLQDLSRVNILIGKNNSGKSRFLRSIFYYNNLKLKFITNNDEFIKFQNKVKNFKDSNIFYSNDDKNAHKRIKDTIEEINYLFESQSPYNDLTDLFMEINSAKRLSSIGVSCDKLFKKYFDNINFSEELFNYNFYKIYIPSLRSLMPLSAEDLFAQRINNDYFKDNQNIIFNIEKSFNKNNIYFNTISTGFYFYENIRNFLLGDLKNRKIIEDYQNYLSKNFFNNENVALIPKLDDDVLTVKIGNEKEQPIYNLGEGIQNIILITLPLFLYLEKSKEQNTNILVCIEEPEVGLHPELQRKLINTFLDEKFNNFQFFFTTHSNHFIDKIFEEENISIYLFDKNVDNDEESIAKFNIEKVSFDNFSIINELGVLHSSVLQSNCTILVEGITDVMHYRLYLKLYQEHMVSQNPNFKKFIEKTHFSFMIGGGSSIKNSIDIFNKLDKEKILFIFDCDTKSKREKNIKFLESNNCKYYILPVIEVENLISKKILLEILKDIKEFHSIKIKDDFDGNEYKSSKFYDFIKNEILSELPQNMLNSKSLKELLSDKEVKFAKNYEDLSSEAKKIGEKIYNFIKLNNY